MDLGSPDKGLEIMGDLREKDGFNSVTKLDLNLSVNKEGAESYGFENGEKDERVQVNLNQQGQDGSPSLPADFGFEASQTFCTKSSSPVQADLDRDYIERNTYEGERSQSPANDTLYQGKMELVHGNCSAKSSSPVEAESFQNEMETGSSAQYCLKSASAIDTNSGDEMEIGSSAHYSLKSASAVDTNNGGVDLEVGSDSYRPKVAPISEEVKENSSMVSENLLYEKSTCEPIEGEGTDCSSPRLKYNGIEIKNEVFNHVEMPPGKNGKLEIHDSGQHSPGRGYERSTSSMRRVSVSPERSPSSQQSPGHKPYSSTQGVEDVSYSPGISKQKRSPHVRSGRDNEGVLPDYNLSPGRRISASPQRRSQHDSRRRDDSSQKHISKSPRRHYSPENGQRWDRSALRRDSSSGHRRDHRDRSRSRSPYTKDRDRRSPRRRYSPRRISSASGYHSRHRSPRRKPWSPPPNRSTGVGRPGNSLFVAGFSFVTTERDLERKFSRFGRVRDVRIVRDKRSGDSRGFGFLTLERDEDADAAIRALDQTEWNGRIVLVEKSKTSGR